MVKWGIDFKTVWDVRVGFGKSIGTDISNDCSAQGSKKEVVTFAQSGICLGIDEVETMVLGDSKWLFQEV